MLCQLSYAPGLPGQCTRRFAEARFRLVRAPGQRRALGALFLCLGLGFVGIAVAAAAASSAGAGRWVIVLAAAVIGIWMLGLALRAFRSR